MNKPRVSYEQAVRLKAVRYDVKTDGYFNTDKNSPLRIDSAYDYNRYTNACSVPYVDDVCRWMRDVHGLHVMPKPYFVDSEYYYWDCDIITIPYSDICFQTMTESHDDAQSAAIDACLIIIEERKKTEQ